MDALEPHPQDAQFQGVVRVVAWGTLALHSTLVAWGAWSHSPAWDEIGHLPAGLSHWQLGRFDYYRVNPPLVRLVATAPLLLANPRLVYRMSSDPRVRLEFDSGHEFIHSYGELACSYFSIARLACIPFSLLGGYVCYRWARDLYGVPSALLALALWCFSPSIFANAQMITPDTGATALGVAACYTFWRWLREPNWHWTFITGLALGLAESAKFTWVILFGIWPLLFAVWQWPRPASPGPCALRTSVLRFAVILGLCVYMINVCYGFEDSFWRLGDYRFVSDTLTGDIGNRTGNPVNNRFVGTWLESVRVPFPRNYLLGIDVQKRDFEQRLWSYLGGEWRFGGWWYFYLYALSIKAPLGTWGLVLLALAVRVAGCRYTASWRDEAMLLITIAVILIFVSSQAGFSHHLRYVLPILPFAFVWMSKVAREIRHRGSVMGRAVTICTTWSIMSSLWIYPHSLSYFNELVGGPANGHAYLLFSNVDWGQDLLYLKRWLARNPVATPIGLAPSLPVELLDPADVGIEFVMAPFGPDTNFKAAPRISEEVGPRPGWYAIAVSRLQSRSREYIYFERFQPIARVGYSILIYHLTAEEIERKASSPGNAVGETSDLAPSESEKQRVPAGATLARQRVVPAGSNRTGAVSCGYQRICSFFPEGIRASQRSTLSRMETVIAKNDAEMRKGSFAARSSFRAPCPCSAPATAPRSDESM